MGNLKDLSLALMVRLSQGWLDPQRSRSAIEKLPTGKALVARIDTTLQGLLSTQKQDSKAAKELSALQEDEAELDKRHDRLLRGIYWVLTGLAELAEAAEDEAALLAARDELFPKGLSMTQRTYAEEAGEVTLAEARVSAASRALLKKMPLPKEKLWNAVERWFGSGQAIGKAEERRRTIEAKLEGTDGSGASRSSAVKARNTWIKVVRHMETTLDLEEAEEATIKAILGPVYEAVKATSRRAGGKGAPQEPEAAPAEDEKAP